MTFFQAALLGMIQGLTEFLPVSSSGHLALAEAFLHIPLSNASLQGFDIVLHAGTLCALLICYRKTWWRLLGAFFGRNHAHRALLVALIISTIPAVVVGVLFQNYIVELLRSPMTVGLAFLLTALVLLLGERFPVHRRSMALPRTRAFLIGCAQACALVPGLSRSGLTISAARMAGLSRSEALDFSFLMAAPVIAGAGLITAKDAFSGAIFLPPISIVILGFCTSLLVSIGTVLFLRRWVAMKSLGWFALYLIPLGTVLIAKEMIVGFLS
ncbi:MAG: undecaprenyl-diphosphate phosphatase [Candidatus Peribacteraceae bacterium]|jgi:undecaprenyl-diphosphatase